MNLLNISGNGFSCVFMHGVKNHWYSIRCFVAMETTRSWVKIIACNTIPVEYLCYEKSFLREKQQPFSILCLTSRTTVTSARIPEEDACHRAHNLCVFSCVQKGTQRLTHKGYVLQRVSLGTLSDVTVVLGMRQSIVRIWTELSPVWQAKMLT